MNNENKIIFSRNLKHYMELNGVDRNKLCSDLDFKYSTVSEWISAKKYPRMDKIEMLAAYFGIKKSALIEQAQPESKSDDKLYFLDDDKIRKIPVFECVAAGLGARAENCIVDYIPLYIKSDSEAEETVGIKVSGNSMYPRIEDGDIIQVRIQSDVEDGSVAVVFIDGDEAVVKRLYREKNRVILKSDNPEWEPRVFEGSEAGRLHIYGLVKSVIKSV